MKKIIYFGLIFLLAGSFSFQFFVIPVKAASVNYYVDSTGTDDGDHGTGTGTDAWATIEYAINNVANPESDKVIINISGDTYTIPSRIDINRIFKATVKDEVRIQP